ncbi:MAG: coiled-coil protein, partial [Thermoplasmatota archaeon]
LNSKVRELVDKANQHKSKRDELNVNVRAAKGKRDELNMAANTQVEAFNALKKDKLPREGESIGKLKHRLRQLEFEQQTKVLTPKKEKELMDQISATVKELKMRESAFEADTTVRGAYDAMKTAKAAAEDQHRAVTELANAAQAEHDAMVRLFEEADKFRKEADGAQEQFIKSKVEADKVHHDYIDMVNQIRDLEKVVNSLRTKERRSRGETTAHEAKAEAEDIFAKFREGGKLSTEDLMALQKAGLL